MSYPTASPDALAIAMTRAGLEVGALGAKSTHRGLPDSGLRVPSDPLD